jgi:hypothetical protein
LAPENRDAEIEAALALAIAGDTARAQALAAELSKLCLAASTLNLQRAA